MARSRPSRTFDWLFAVAGAAAAGYAAYVAVTWRRYGRPSRPAPGDEDELLDRFLPAYDVADRHRIEVAAPAAVTFRAAKEVDLRDAPLARAVFRGRELLLRAAPEAQPPPRGLLATTLSLGWGVLAEVPDREIVVGAVTRPWEANVVFRAVPPDEFAAFAEPDYVKIVWTLRADPTGESTSILRTETRAAATDAAARAKFRRYWSLLSPGIILIRRAMLPRVRGKAERRFGSRSLRAARFGGSTAV